MRQKRRLKKEQSEEGGPHWFPETAFVQKRMGLVHHPHPSWRRGLNSTPKNLLVYPEPQL